MVIKAKPFLVASVKEKSLYVAPNMIEDPPTGTEIVAI
jgi:hypothetical protein